MKAFFLLAVAILLGKIFSKANIQSLNFTLYTKIERKKSDLLIV